MGFSANPFHYIKKGYDAIVNPDGTPQAPGVGGPAADPTKLIRDPSTGFYYDPTTGTSYTDPSGALPVKDPNVAQQVAHNYTVSNNLLNAGQEGADMLRSAYAGETGLANSLNNTINNPNASSVAQSQLTQGADNLARQQLGIASGVGGANAASARRQAAQNIGQIGMAGDQASAIVRAGEVGQAQGRLADVLNAQAGQGAQYYGQNLQGAGQFAGMAGQGASGHEARNLDQANADRAGWAGFVNGAAGAGQKALMGG